MLEDKRRRALERQGEAPALQAQTIAGVFSRAADAREAIAALTRAGCSRDAISVIRQGEHQGGDVPVE